MKISKRILSAVLALCLVFGCTAAGLTAFASDATPTEVLQAGINDAIAQGKDYSWTGGNITLTAPISIDGDIKVDFNGAVVKGAEGREVVNIYNGDVELYDGSFVAYLPDYQRITGFINTISGARAAIVVRGGNVTLDCVSAVGSLVRIVGMSGKYMPIGNAIEVFGENGGNLTVKNTLAFGMCGIQNQKASHAAANVYVEDCILLGLNESIWCKSKVTYAAGTTQYKTLDVIEDSLNEGVSMTDREAEYVEYFTDRIGGSIISVADPVLADPTSSYDQASDKLTVTALADNTNMDATVTNRYSYKYTPDTCTIGDETVNFVEQADGTFVAEFADMAADTTYDADINYKLSINMGVKQTEIVTTILDTIDEFVDTAPAYIDKAINQFDAKYEEITTALQLIWNAYNEYAAELESAKPALFEEFKLLVGQVFNIMGADLDDTYNNIPSRAKPGYIASVNQRYGANLAADGKGLADKFDDYYATFKTLLLTFDETGKVTGFNDIEAAGKYIGDNYLDMYQVVKDAQPVLETVYDLITNPESELSTYADSLSSYTGYMEMASEYLTKIIDKVDSALENNTKYNALVDAYGDEFGTYCGIYAKKAYNIVSNPNTYFSFDVEDSFINLFDIPQTAQFVTPADTKECVITVNVIGYGKAQVGGEEFTTTREFKVPQGSLFSIVPVEYGIGELFQQFVYAQPNSTWKATEKFESFRVGGNATISVMFSSLANAVSDSHKVVFLTDKHLNNSWIGDIEGEPGDDFEIPEPTRFSGLEFLGWSTDPNATTGVSDAEITDIINANTDDMFVYAIYSGAETVAVSSTDVISMLSCTYDAETNKVYFKTYFHNPVPGTYHIVQAGVLVSKDVVALSEATPVSYPANVFVSRSLSTDANGYVIDDLVYNYGVGSRVPATVYGRGYLVLETAPGVHTTYYTDIFSGDVA